MSTRYENLHTKMCLYQFCNTKFLTLFNKDIMFVHFHLQAELENLIAKRPGLAQNTEGRVAWEGDALHQVLGEEKPGQVHGMVLLPIPKQVYGRTTRRFKDINIATIYRSSSDVETHMLEEIKQLKEHARNQDKVIEEILINKQERHGNEEQTKVPMSVISLTL